MIKTTYQIKVQLYGFKDKQVHNVKGFNEFEAIGLLTMALQDVYKEQYKSAFFIKIISVKVVK